MYDELENDVINLNVQNLRLCKDNNKNR